MKRGLLMFPVGAVGGFLCGFVVAGLCFWFDLGLFGREKGSLSIGEYAAWGLIWGYVSSVTGFVLAPIVYFICFTELNNRELIKAISLIAADTSTLGLLGGLLVNSFYAWLMTMVGFFGSSLAAYSYFKDKPGVLVKGGGAG